MTLLAFILIFISVFLHAGWNFLSKKHRPSGAFMLLANSVGAIICLPFLFFARIDCGSLPVHFWILLLVSGVFEVMYMVGLFQSYRRNDISLAYPLVRALPVLFTAAVTFVFGIGKPLTAGVFAGMIIVSFGCIIMPLHSFADFKWSNYFNSAFLFILLSAAGTTGYTIADSVATKLLVPVSSSSGIVNTGVYLCGVNTLLSLGLLIYVRSQKREMRELKNVWRKPFYPVVSGIFCTIAYALVVIAMQFVENVSFVQAFRQMSLPVGVVMGIVLLKEARSRIKLLGIACVLTGLIIVSLCQ